MRERAVCERGNTGEGALRKGDVRVVPDQRSVRGGLWVIHAIGTTGEETLREGEQRRERA